VVLGESIVGKGGLGIDDIVPVRAGLTHRTEQNECEPSSFPKTTQLRTLLESSSLEFLMEAHNGLSARIVEEAGFRGIWASGLTISASLCVRDNNEASWTQVLEVLEFMSDASAIPILLDGDTGYGNFNNARRLVRKLEQRGIAGVCFEDKLFPKTNSFIDGSKQQLATVEEFAGKLRAAKDAQHDPDFCLVARTEAFIAGWGLDEALRRAEAYHQAGADAVLVHSKIRKPHEILAFMDAWQNTCPVVIVPTMYYSTPSRTFADAGVSIAIWANHMLRAATQAMQQTASLIHADGDLLTVEDHIVPVAEIFRLQGATELRDAEDRYLPTASPARAIILAASRGENLGSLTKDVPKAMLEVHGEPILEKLVDHFVSVGVRDVVVVVGYKAEAVELSRGKKVFNPRYAEAKELYSLSCALEQITGPTYISYGDILIKRYILHTLESGEEHDIAIVVDSAVDLQHHQDRYTDWIRASRPDHGIYSEEPVTLLEMDPHLDHAAAVGEWVGLARFSPEGADTVRDAIEELQSRPDFDKLRMSDLFNHLVQGGHPVHVCYISGHWMDIDDLEIYSKAMDF
jgi:phosphoenolpyruvate phosphomutase